MDQRVVSPKNLQMIDGIYLAIDARRDAFVETLRMKTSAGQVWKKIVGSRAERRLYLGRLDR
jgi:hypothetical protein